MRSKLTEIKNKGNSKGITLVALVITIVIIIILSTIAINFTFGENGLITRAQQAAEMSEVSRILEQLEMAKGSAYIDGAGEIDPDHYFDILEEEGIIEDKETDVVDNGDNTYDVTTEGDRVFEVTLEPNGDLDIEYIGKNNEPRISEIKVTDKTENSISVEVVTRNVENAEYTYSYKKTAEGEETWQEAGSSSSNTFTFSGLENNTSYDIKVTVKLDDGTTIEKTITVQLGEETPPVPEIPDNTITFGQAAWQGDGTANMQISTTESGYTLQYQIGSTSGEWITIISGQSITGLKHGDTVYARLTDGENDSEIQQTTIEDKTVPEVNVTAEEKTSNSITVSVSAVDKESGMSDNVTYTYSIKQSGNPDYSVEATDISQNKYTFSNLQAGISYDIKVEVKADKAGNMGIGYLAGQTTTDIPGGEDLLEDGTITVGDTVWADGKASIDISTDSGYQIEYQVNGTEDGSWTKIGNRGTVSELKYGDTVNIRLTDGTNHGDFVTVTIGDEIAPTVDVSLGTSTSNSISVNVVATDAESGMSGNPVYTYYIKESTEPDSSYVAPDGATDIAANTYTFANLKQNTSYDIKVEVKADIAGNMGTGTLLNQKTKTIPSGGGETEQGITFGEPIWSEGKASITVSTETEYTIEYKLSAPEEDAGWTTIENNGTISELSHGSTVYARLTDGVNHGDYATKNIQDEINPVVDVKLDGLTTSSSIKVNVTASDKESGMTASPTYTYYIKQSSEEDTEYVAKANNITENTYTFTGLTQGTSYDIKVEVTGDNAGNTGTGYLAGQTTATVPDAGGPEVEEGAITFGTVSWSSNKASISVSTNTSYQIEYQVGGITEGSWTGIANNGTISNLNYGDTVYARLTDGVNHGEYATASIDDKTNPQAATISLSGSEATTKESITATVTLTDNESGADVTGSKWIYNTNAGSIGIDEASYTNSFTVNPEELTLSAETAGTYYLHVLTKDIAGNKIETVSEAVIIEQAPPDMSDAKPNTGEDGPEFGTNTPIQDDQGNTVVIPGGFHLDKDSGTSVEEGIVIEDSNGNQFVWIPTGTYNVTDAVDNDGTKDGKLTNNLSRRIWGGINQIVTPTEISENTGIEVNTCTFYGEKSAEIDAFKNSVSMYGGFYIGRYELGYDGAMPGYAIKAGLVPTGYISKDESMENIERICSENTYVKCELISSYAWDTALNFICQTNSEGYVLATTTSSSYGNIGTGGNTRNTGAYAADNYSNIHDLLGNCYEWTTEYSSDIANSYHGVARGGSTYSGNVFAAYRENLNERYTGAYFSARPQLYIK